MHTTSVLETADGHPVHINEWRPTGDVRGIVQIAHGVAEHSARYDAFARTLADHGYAVFADDHRGHGLSASVLGDFGDDGWNRILGDMLALNQRARAAYPATPLVLFGHSMGAMLTQHYLCRHGSTVDVAILSGSPGFASPLMNRVLRWVSRFERFRVGPRSTSAVMEKLLFGRVNAAFEDGADAPTGHEWLSRDPSVPAAYAADNQCGFIPDTGSLCDWFDGVAESAEAAQIAGIPKTLPILVFSGSADPVHADFANIHRLLRAWRARGLTVQSRFYPGGRHEMLNETNRDEVVTDILRFLEVALSNADVSSDRHAAA